jgi:hypothetical protein
MNQQWVSGVKVKKTMILKVGFCRNFNSTYPVTSALIVQHQKWVKNHS